MKTIEKIGRLKIVQERSKGKKIAIACMLGIGSLVVFGQLLSTKYSVIRIKHIKARPAVIFPYLNDLKKWESWFPWKNLDENLKFQFGEITSGVGANLSWTGQGGQGTLTFIKSTPEKGIDYQFSLHDGYYKCDVYFHYTELKEGNTYITWTVKGDLDRPIVGGYLTLLMEPVLGAILERGLSRLKYTVKQDIKKRDQLRHAAEKKQ